MLSIKMVIHDCRPAVTESTLFLRYSFAFNAAGTLRFLHKKGKAIQLPNLLFDGHIGSPRMGTLAGVARRMYLRLAVSRLLQRAVMSYVALIRRFWSARWSWDCLADDT
jgi:hypothetical protein